MADRTYATKTNRRLPFSPIRHLHSDLQEHNVKLMIAEPIQPVRDPLHSFATA